MEKIKTFDELNRIQHDKAVLLAQKFTGENNKRSVVICGGTGCISSNSHQILQRMEELIKEKGLESRISVNQVGCFGFCSQGPFVKIFPEDTLYHAVTVEDVDEIVEKDLEKGIVVERLLYTDPVTGEKVTKQDDITFYKKQHRIALEECGMINPEDIGEALGSGAFQGLKKALGMKRRRSSTPSLPPASEDAAAQDSPRAANGSSPSTRARVRNMSSATVTRATPAHSWTGPSSRVTRLPS